MPYSGDSYPLQSILPRGRQIRSLKEQGEPLSQREQKRKPFGAGQAALNLSLYPAGGRLQPRLHGIHARLPERLKQAARPLVSPIAPVFEYLMVGIGLGILGAALLTCAIPVLICIPHL